jgi:hypothetical protein
MPSSVTRQAPDFSATPRPRGHDAPNACEDLFGVRTLIGFRKPIELAGAARPEGLLHYENNIVFSLSPMRFATTRKLPRLADIDWIQHVGTSRERRN